MEGSSIYKRILIFTTKKTEKKYKRSGSLTNNKNNRETHTRRYIHTPEVAYSVSFPLVAS